MSEEVTPRHPVIFVSFDDDYAKSLVRDLDQLCPAAHVTPLLRTLQLTIESLQPAVAVFDLQTIKTEEHSIFDIMALVNERFPGIRKIGLGHQSLPAQVISAMKAGAVDFIDRQASMEEIRQAVSHQLRHVRLSQSERPGRVFAFVSPRENEGVSDLAANLATHIAVTARGETVLLLDLNLEPSQLEIEFDVEITYSVRDALDELLRLDKAVLSEIVPRHKSGLYLLPLAARNHVEEEVSPQDLATLIGVLRNNFSIIIVKAGCLRDKYCQSFLVPLFDMTFIVCPQLIGSVRNARALIADELRGGNAESKFGLIVSQYDANIELAPSQIGARIGVPLVASVPCTRVALANSHNEGSPLVLTSGGGRYGRAIRDLAHHILGLAQKEGSAKVTAGTRMREWVSKVAGAVT